MGKQQFHATPYRIICQTYRYNSNTLSKQQNLNILKEIIDTNAEQLGGLWKSDKNIKFERVQVPHSEYFIFKVDILVYIKGRPVIIGKGEASKKADAEQEGCKQGYINLRQMGYTREYDPIYKLVENM